MSSQASTMFTASMASSQAWLKTRVRFVSPIAGSTSARISSSCASARRMPASFFSTPMSLHMSSRIRFFTRAGEMPPDRRRPSSRARSSSTFFCETEG